MTRENINKLSLILLVLFISAIFFSMIRPFLMAIFLAGIFSAMAHPFYRKLEQGLKGRRGLASLVTLLLIVMVVLLPLTGLLGIVTAQAVKVGHSVSPWIQKQLESPDSISKLFNSLPFHDQIIPYRDQILQKAGELVGSISTFLINSLSSVTIMTVNLIFMFCVLLYTMYFFLIEGDKILQKILYYLPLEDKDEQRMLDRFTSVTRATLKGTAVIGILQGGLAGLAFWVVGIDSAVFWGTIMTVLSIIPGIGSALVWFPAAVVLAAGGHLAKALGLLIFCGGIVGSLDNFLRPRLVGKDTEMPDLLIFFGTLGGIAFFGFLGFIVGPIVAALFVTVWEIYGEAFRDVLPQVGKIIPASKQKPIEPSEKE